ncbi:prenylated flavin chaperone LpdD [Cohnella fermenti]|uniref:Prenylated flavin chaperone LpdD-like domain-containing protein n=1 Tax=Cohnella fermenti TaxID=2565925 RepID=A0A4V3WGD6_9BACL|nr:hypothetical protein [Cohnella fermenti]THF83327.1 hypothetical protein E6C55_05615 [Cohnella fermenti]
MSGIEIDIRRVSMGRDVVFIVTGGTAHLGAAAVACGEDGRIVHASAWKLPGHREEELAAELAAMAALSLGRTVAVLAGIHLDRPTRLEIEEAVAAARSRMRQALDEFSC